MLVQIWAAVYQMSSPPSQHQRSGWCLKGSSIVPQIEQYQIHDGKRGPGNAPSVWTVSMTQTTLEAGLTSARLSSRRTRDAAKSTHQGGRRSKAGDEFQYEFVFFAAAAMRLCGGRRVHISLCVGAAYWLATQKAISDWSRTLKSSSYMYLYIDFF
jgi:hypothetical protein